MRQPEESASEASSFSEPDADPTETEPTQNHALEREDRRDESHVPHGSPGGLYTPLRRSEPAGRYSVASSSTRGRHPGRTQSVRNDGVAELLDLDTLAQLEAWLARALEQQHDQRNDGAQGVHTDGAHGQQRCDAASQDEDGAGPASANAEA